MPYNIIQSKKSKVLVIDSSITEQQVMLNILTGLHYEVAQAQDGIAGVRLVASFEPDVIIIDHYVDKIEIMLFITSIRSDPVSSGTKFIIMKLPDDIIDKRTERDLQPCLFLNKPFNQRSLEKILKKADSL